jgi:hypothetical protein
MQLSKSQLDKVRYELRKMNVPSATSAEMRTASVDFTHFDAERIASKVVENRQLIDSGVMVAHIQELPENHDKVTLPNETMNESALSITEKQQMVANQSAIMSVQLEESQIVAIADQFDFSNRESESFLSELESAITAYIRKSVSDYQLATNKTLLLIQNELRTAQSDVNIATEQLNTGIESLGGQIGGFLKDLKSNQQATKTRLLSRFSV